MTNVVVPMRTVLEWHDFAQKKPRKGGGPILVTDGIIHRVGWWSVTEQKFIVPNSDGTNGVSDIKITCWAEMPNMVRDIESYLGHQV